MSTNFDWVEMPALEFEIRGLDGSRIQFVSERFLANGIITAAIGFHTTLTLRTPQPIAHPFRFADYQVLRPFRDALAAIRNGTGETATLTGAGFLLAIRLHKIGAREGLLVEGYFSSIGNVNHVPWPTRVSIGDLVLRDSEPAGCIRFAFLSSLVDPPYVDNAIAGIDAILQFLEDEGFQA